MRMHLGLVGASLVLLTACPPKPQQQRLLRVVPYRPASLPATELEVLAASGVDARDVGFLLAEVGTGSVVAEHLASRAFMPASVTKLVSTAAALEILGPSHRFDTLVLARGPLKDGVLDGDLYLRGEGDPRLTVPQLLSLAADLRRAGVREVRGRFLYDETFLLPSEWLDPKQDPESTYNPPSSALSLETNTLALQWRPTLVAGEAEAFTIPALPDISVALAPEPFPDGARVKLQAPLAGSPTSGAPPEVWFLSPSIDPAGTLYVPLRKPALRVALLFRRLAQGEGVRLPEPQPEAAPPDARILAQHTSRPLVAHAEELLSTSDNLMTELVAQAAARRLTGRPLTLAESAEALVAWWRARRPEVDWSTARLLNASGLSEDTRLSPRQLIAVLEEAASRDYDGREFASLLATAGSRGTLSKRLETPETSLVVWAKTGSMDYGVGLAGELLPSSGRPLRFVIFVNDLDARAEAARRRAAGDFEGTREHADAWTRRARSAMDGLVRLWMGSM